MINQVQVVRNMALLRVIAGTLEIAAGILMVRSGNVAVALQINSILGLVGPMILAAVSFLGVAGLAGRLSLNRLAIVGLGVLLILIGTRQR
ncbi:MAG: DUF2619 domain-containing protein [Firmicutes bacterium]|nr:DUF2619 domain-containing protein [Bacillota bacterium]